MPDAAGEEAWDIGAAPKDGESPEHHGTLKPPVRPRAMYSYGPYIVTALYSYGSIELWPVRPRAMEYLGPG